VRRGRVEECQPSIVVRVVFCRSRFIYSILQKLDPFLK
jgi:hypothetical protein